MQLLPHQYAEILIGLHLKGPASMFHKHLWFHLLQPGLDMNEFRQTVLNGNNRIEGDETIDAYETLMLDLLSGEQSKFLHIDEVKAAWKLVDPIIDYWSKDKSKPTQYKPGEFDPEESKVIFEDEGQFWKK